jgi:transcriptional regulator with XRE-family HTH domain
MQPEELKALRQRKGWSQADLAKRLDISKSRLQDFERGRTAGAQSKPAPIPAMMELACRWLAIHGGDGRGTPGDFAAIAAAKARERDPQGPSWPLWGSRADADEATKAYFRDLAQRRKENDSAAFAGTLGVLREHGRRDIAQRMEKQGPRVSLDTSPAGGPVPPELAELAALRLEEEPPALSDPRRWIAESVMADLEFEDALAVVVGWQANLPPEAQATARAALCG